MSWRMLWTGQTGQCHLAMGAAPCQREWQGQGHYSRWAGECYGQGRQGSATWPLGQPPAKESGRARGTLADELENAMDRADRAVPLGHGAAPCQREWQGQGHSSRWAGECYGQGRQGSAAWPWGQPPVKESGRARGTLADELENAMDRADRAVLLGHGGSPLSKRVAGPGAL